MEDSPKKWQRATLTKAARATALGAELVAILTRILRDGQLQENEARDLRAWLAQARAEYADIPAIAMLRDVVEAALQDGVITDEERQEIIAIMLRILPAADRAGVKSQVEAVHEAEMEALKEELAREKEESRKAKLAERIALKQAEEEKRRRREEERRDEPPRWHYDAATSAQLRYLKALGAVFDGATLTKGEASRLIDSMLDSAKSVSNRQMMVLRFWGKTDLADYGKATVSEWMDAWYGADPDHVAAWELWKEANGDWGCKDADPLKVPMGCGTEWLQRVKNLKGANG